MFGHFESEFGIQQNAYRKVIYAIARRGGRSYIFWLQTRSTVFGHWYWYNIVQYTVVQYSADPANAKSRID
jgi:hypothetical protein